MTSVHCQPGRATEAYLEAPIRPSRLATIAVGVMGLLALMGVLISGLSWWLQTALVLVLLVFLGQSLLRVHQLPALMIAIEGERLVLVDHRAEGMLLGQFRDVFVSPWYLSFRAVRELDGTRLHCGFFRDQLDQAAFRRLAAWLRQGESR
jgi:hypothetical protein